MPNVEPLPCCVEHARQLGVEPSLKVLCPPCDDYRGWMTYTRYAKVYRPMVDVDPNVDA